MGESDVLPENSLCRRSVRWHRGSIHGQGAVRGSLDVVGYDDLRAASHKLEYVFETSLLQHGLTREKGPEILEEIVTAAPTIHECFCKLLSRTKRLIAVYICTVAKILSVVLRDQAGELGVSSCRTNYSSGLTRGVWSSACLPCIPVSSSAPSSLK